MRNQRAVQIVFRFAAIPAVGNAARHIWGIGKITRSGFLNDDEIFFHDVTDNPQPSGAKVLRHVCDGGSLVNTGLSRKG